MVGKYIALLCFSAGDDWESLRQKVSQFVHDVSLEFAVFPGPYDTEWKVTPAADKTGSFNHGSLVQRIYPPRYVKIF